MPCFAYSIPRLREARFQVEVVATGLTAPAGLSFLPDGRLLVADRPEGRLSLFDPSTRSLVIHEERLLLDRGWKIRCVQQAPDGSLYIGVDGGLLARISPAQ
jgi:glucose/arabinose dehydrogenase